MSQPACLVMLTQNDRTSPNAPALFEACRSAQATFFGFKEVGLPFSQMQTLFFRMKQVGKQTALEVVAYTEEEGLRGAQMAADCGCDYLLGTQFFPSVLQFCKQNGIRYLPYIGQVSGRPSVLSGDAQEMVRQANVFLRQGAFGVTLLAYRYTGDCDALLRTVCGNLSAPVCIAGSVNSYEKLAVLKDLHPWAFTIGSAFFDGAFGTDFPSQIDAVCTYMQTETEN